jgi:hypothetical protein
MADHMGFFSSVTTFVVDSVLFPISYIPKIMSGGQTLGDMLTGTERPPSHNSTLGNVGAFTVDLLTAPVSLPLRMFTGNSIGDYVTGDSNETREKIIENKAARETLTTQQSMNVAGAPILQPEIEQGQGRGTSFVAQEMARRQAAQQSTSQNLG